MAEHVLGIGHQPNIFTMFKKFDHHLGTVEGAALEVRARAGAFKIVAHRDTYSTDFAQFEIEIAQEELILESLKTWLTSHSEDCRFEMQSGKGLLSCPVVADAHPDKVALFLEAFSHEIALPEVWHIEGFKYRDDSISVELIFQALVQYKASDIHLSPGASPVFRIDNDTRRSDMLEPLSSTQIYALVEQIAPEMYLKQFYEKKQASFNFHQVGLGYARVSAFIKSGAPHCTFRFLPEKVPTFEALHVPSDVMTQMANLHSGLVLVTGMTGSGKTTTVAALVDWINSHKSGHILTIEDPVEFVHPDKKCIVSQRNLGSDVNSFKEAVEGALRHDPDVILIGEMRDSDTIRSAITAAATGHLVISTLHSNTAAEVVNRIVGFFDPIERDLVKVQLRDSLECIICQRLVPKIGGGRVPALEIMLNDIKPISDGIVQGHTDNIRIGMQQTVTHSFLFENYLHDLYKKGVIDLEHAHEYASEVSMFDQLRMGTYSVPRVEALKH